MIRQIRNWRVIICCLCVGLLALNIILLSKQGHTEHKTEKCESINIAITGVPNVTQLRSGFPENDWGSVKPHKVSLTGRHRSQPSYLTVGIPSVKRVNDKGLLYLMQTLASLISTTPDPDKNEIVVIVFLADFDADYNNKVTKHIVTKHSRYVQSGFIQIIQVSPDFYPKLIGLKRNFNDGPNRVTWRAKQVADFAFMFLYARNISSYYIQIEDDVVCSNNFLTAIRNFISSYPTPWSVMDFSELGFIGKLFKSSDLTKLAHFMLTFYDEQPVDWLIRSFRMSMAQSKVIMRRPTLFQHMGLTSSFDVSKDNKLKDRFFDPGGGSSIMNPEAGVYTSIKAYRGNTVDLAYNPGEGYFWAMDLKANDSISVVFDTEQILDKVVVETGNKEKHSDILKSGWVEVSPEVRKYDPHGGIDCGNAKKIAEFSNGRLESNSLDQVLDGIKIKCLKIVVGATQSEWVIFSAINIFTKHS